MLHAYLDDSGTHADSPWCVVAGYFGSERHWKRFDREWQIALESEGVEEFHANRFWASVGGNDIPEYRGWSRERSNRFVGRLLDVIGSSHRISPVCCAVLMEEWHKLAKDERAYLTGGAHNQQGQIVTPGAPNKPYFLPFLTAISMVLDYCNPGQLVDFSFDQSRHFSGYALKYFEEIKKWDLEKFKRMGDVLVVDSKRATPVQAADLLAFESYRYGLARLKRICEY